ncbi:MAG: hypothetical protein SGCHY_001295 [Lobulomycetales sp.]
MGDLPQKELPTQKPESNVKTAIANIRFSDFAPSSFLNLACSKKALLYGGLAGTTIGVTRFMITRRIKTSGNYALLAFSLVAASSWEFCRFQRRIVQEQLHRMEAEDRKLVLEKNSEV